MPPPKRAAKKSAGHHDPKHHEPKDLRRAYEHLGRVESLQRTLPGSSQKDVAALVSLAQQELHTGRNKEAADLLRASEHLSFAALAGHNGKLSQLSKELEAGIAEELDHLTRKAEEHWENSADRHAAVASLYKSSLKNAKRAQQQGSYREALELSRAAEALAHVQKHGPGKLQNGREDLKLAAS